MRKNVRKTALLTAAVFACFAGQPACAQEPEAYQLDTVVVTATRSERAPLDTPANVTIITAKEIRDKGYQSAFEAVQELSQANVHTYQQDGGDYGSMMSRIRLRGIDDATLVLINGNPANYMNHASLNNIPVDQIAKIEIVKGANSVLYGPQAMGGVINIITKRPEKTGEVHGTVSGSYGTRRNTGSLSVTTDSVNAGYRKQVYRDFHNVATPGSQGNSTTAIDIVGKRGEQYYVDAAVGKDLTFSYGRTENQSSYKTGRWRNYVPTLNRLTQYRSTFDNYSLAYDNKENGWKAYVGYNSIRADVLPDKSFPSRSSYSYSSGYSANADVQKRFRLAGDDALIVGTNYNRENLEQRSTTTRNENTRDTYSLYQSYNFHPTDKLEFIVGLREFYADSTKYQDSDFQILPQVQGLYKATKDSSYYFNVGKSFQLPSISSAFYYSDNLVINPDLKPQSGWSYEAGYKYDDGKKALSADVFYMDVKDKFYWDQDDENHSIMRNRDKWKNVGLEVNYKQKFDDNWSGNVGLTWQNPKGTTKGVWQQDSAKYILQTGATYERSKFTADARLFAYLKREKAYYNRTHTSSKTKDHNLKNYLDVGLQLSYRPTDQDAIRLACNNLLDRDDVLNNYEYYVWPRSYTLTYERKF